MSQIIEAPLPYASGEQQHLGLLLRAADQQPTAAVALLPDWRGQSGLARDHALYLVQQGCVVVIANTQLVRVTRVRRGAAFSWRSAGPSINVR